MARRSTITISVQRHTGRDGHDEWRVVDNSGDLDAVYVFDDETDLMREIAIRKRRYHNNGYAVHVADQRERTGFGRADRPARRANDALHDLVAKRYFSAIPLDRIYDIIEESGFAFDAEDKSCILCGREGKATWELFHEGRPAKRMLVVTWYKMDVTGRYEVVAYVS
jgi:hypothetical protein